MTNRYAKTDIIDRHFGGRMEGELGGGREKDRYTENNVVDDEQEKSAKQLAACVQKKINTHTHKR